MSYLKKLLDEGEIPVQLTIDQAAELTGISYWTLRKYIRQGKIPYRKIGTRIYIDTFGIDEWLDEQTVQPLRDTG